MSVKLLACVSLLLLILASCSAGTAERLAQRTRPTPTSISADIERDLAAASVGLAGPHLEGRSIAESVRSFARMWDDTNRLRFEADPDSFVRVPAEAEQFGVGFVDDVRIFSATLDDESLFGGMLDDTGAVKASVTLTGLGGPANDAVAATSLALFLGDGRAFDDARLFTQDLVTVVTNERRVFLAGDSVVVIERRPTDGFISIAGARAVPRDSLEQGIRPLVTALLEVASN